MPDVRLSLAHLWQKIAGSIAGALSAAWQTMRPFVPVVIAMALLLVVIIAVGIGFRWRRERVFHGATLRSIDAMDGTEFEEFLGMLFMHLGYHVEHVGTSHDFGADLLLTSRRRQRIVVQAKRYSGSVGIAAVQEVLGALSYYDGLRGMVVTNSRFTDSARELAARSGIELWDRQQLAAALARLADRGRDMSRKSAYNRK